MSNNSSECMKRHQTLYKGKPQAWKETFRQRCLERLRESRSKSFLSKRRNYCTDKVDGKDKETFTKIDIGVKETSGATSSMVDIQDIMRDEWNLMQRENGPDETSTDQSSSVDEMISLFEEIQAELKAEEMKLLQNQEMCDDYVKREEDELCQAIWRLNTVEVICPLCEKRLLMMNKGVVICMCGLRINTEQDGISLKNVQDNLNAGLEEHSNQCDRKPVFSQAEQFGLSNLIISCQDCDFLFIVI